MQVQSLRKKVDDGSEAPYPFTRIHYRSLIIISFTDLTVHVTVDALNRSFDLSNLISANMVMVGQDQGQRSFRVLDELKRCRLDITSVSREGSEVLLIFPTIIHLVVFAIRLRFSITDGMEQTRNGKSYNKAL